MHRSLTSRAIEVQSGWFERLQAFGLGLMSNPRFRRWAAAFPLTRPIARRRALALFDLCAGFVYSQVLLACVRLRVFDILAEGPQAVDTLSRRLTLSRDATLRLLDAAVSLRLVARRRGDRYALGALGATLVGNDALQSMIEHHRMLYNDLRFPVELLRMQVRQGELAQYWPYAQSDQPDQLEAQNVARYSTLMTASQPLIADEVLDAYSIGKHRCLLDVGGGEGAFLAAAAARAPHLRLMLFDLPAVAGRAQARLAELALADRASVHAGSFRTDPLPTGADVVSLVRVLHDHDDDTVLAILAAVRRALPDDGVLLIAEPMSGTRGAEAVADAYFAFYLLAMGSGRTRTPERLGELLHQSGFDRGRMIDTRLPLQTRLLVAHPRLV
ncbi:MAG: methyltransferase [Dokdonella sp.]|uniref:methyltransferase n=1 Tax=Dokdonella sp. TaxID=2291710 RepID=UPI003264C153